MKTRKFVILGVALVFAMSLAVNVQSAMIMVMGSSNTAGGSGYTFEDLSNPNALWASTTYGYNADNITGYYVGAITSDINNDSSLTATFSYYLDTPASILDHIKVRDQYTAGTGFDVRYDTGIQSETWAATNSLDINIYSVKVGPGSIQYFFNPATAAGFWVTRHLEVGKDANNPEISYITSSFIEPIDSPPPGHLPESATMLLFGASLIGLAEVRRLMLK